MSVTLAQIKAHEAEGERIAAALNDLARAVHDARGKGWEFDHYHMGGQLHRLRNPYRFDGWDVWDNSITVNYNAYNQCGDCFSVSFPTAYLDEGFDWRADVASQISAADAVAAQREDAAARMLV